MDLATMTEACADHPETDVTTKTETHADHPETGLIAKTETHADHPGAHDATKAEAEHSELDVATVLVQLAGLVQGVYARVSARHDLTPVQARLLCVLIEGPRGMAELAHCFSVEKAALTGLMDRAERRGLAQRAPVPGNRRALQVTLTDAGRQTATAFHAEISAELIRLIDPLTPHDRDHFRDAMTRIISTCGSGPPTGRCPAPAGEPQP
jgi:DNA-binding MarR family transcriptional regulator